MQTSKTLPYPLACVKFPLLYIRLYTVSQQSGTYQHGRHELQMIRKMNQKTEVTVEIPYGLAKTFYLEAAVKQGTIFGLLFCSVVTDKVNSINGKSYMMIGAEREIENLIFVDDIIGMGSQEKLKSVEKSLQAMEEEKSLLFMTKNQT